MTGSKSFRVFVRNQLVEKPTSVVLGAGFLDGEYPAANVLAEEFFKVNSFEEFGDRISRLNGFYSVVSARESEIYAAVDRVRSIPLFYAVTESDIFLSDNAEWILGQLGGIVLDKFSAGEFLMTGYVTGRHTLAKSVYQLQAGEAISFSNKTETQPSETRRYYRFVHNPAFDEREELMRQLDTAVTNAIERLIRFADGRLIAIPLSGGLDSRLIALLLKRLGYSAVTTFCYGKQGNEESMISRKVADSLELPWTFVPYTEADWRNWYKSTEMSRYIKFSEGLSSEALVQDWPSLKRLTELGVIDKNTVVVPGHTGDFVSGGHIPEELIYFFNLARRDLWRVVRHHHYHLTTLRGAAKKVGLQVDELEAELRRRFTGGTEIHPARTQSEALAIYNCWEWQERQAKFIVNSVRAYEFFGLSWWLPWWDSEVLAVWTKVPLELLKGRQFYREYVKSVEASMNIDVPEFVFPSNKLGGALNGLSTLLWPAAFDIVREQCRGLASYTGSLDRSYFSNPLAVNGVTSIEYYRSLLRHGGSINTILAVLQIERWLSNEL